MKVHVLILYTSNASEQSSLPVPDHLLHKNKLQKPGLHQTLFYICALKKHSSYFAYKKW